MNKKVLISLLILVVLVATGGAVTYVMKKKAAKDAKYGMIPTALAKKADFDILISEVGKLDALKSQTVTSQISGKITRMVPEGSLVKAGETIIWLDTADTEKLIKDMEESLISVRQDLEKTKESQRLQKYQNDMSIEAVKLSVENAKLNYTDASTKLAKNQRLFDAEVIPESTLEDSKLSLLSARASVEKAELDMAKTLETNKSNLITSQIQWKQSEANLRESERKLKEAKDKLLKSVITAPGNGIIVYEMMWRGGDRTKIQEGDQVWERMSIAQLPDLSVMINKIMIDEIDISKVKVGQEVRVRLDALPGVLIKGKITTIATLATDKGGADVPVWMRKEASGVKAFEVTSQLDPNDNPLRPGMTSKTDVLIESFKNVVTVPREAVFERGTRKVVYVSYLTGVKEVEVQTGKGDNNFIIITKGLKGNEKILLRDPTKEIKDTQGESSNKKDNEGSSSPSIPAPAGK